MGELWGERQTRSINCPTFYTASPFATISFIIMHGGQFLQRKEVKSSPSVWSINFWFSTAGIDLYFFGAALCINEIKNDVN